MTVICPHCWNVNVYALKLCGRCGADMHTALQESGGLRWAAPVQSPVPQPMGRRLPLALRLMLLAMVALLALSRLLVPIAGAFGNSGSGEKARAPGAEKSHALPVSEPAW